MNREKALIKLINSTVKMSDKMLYSLNYLLANNRKTAIDIASSIKEINSNNEKQMFDIVELKRLRNKLEEMVSALSIVERKPDWKDVNGKEYLFEEMDMEHLVNIYWYHKIFFNKDIRYENLDYSRELSKRKIDVTNEKYIPVHQYEIEELKTKGMVFSAIYNNKKIIIFKNKTIGELR